MQEISCDSHCHLLLAYYCPFEQDKIIKSDLLHKYYGYKRAIDLKEHYSLLSDSNKIDDKIRLANFLFYQTIGNNKVNPLRAFERCALDSFYFYTVNLIDALINVAHLVYSANRSGRFKLGVGIHPFHLEPYIDHKINSEIIDCINLIKYLKVNYPQALIAGLGEVGLDKRLHTSIAEQVTVLNMYLEGTLEFNLPYSFHCVKAYDVLCKLLKDSRFKGKINGCIHGFNGSYEQAKVLIDLGFKVGLGPSLLLEQNSQRFAKIINHLPHDCLCLESDFDGSKERDYDCLLIPKLRQRFKNLSCHD